jgi:hypothetical protein
LLIAATIAFTPWTANADGTRIETQIGFGGDFQVGRATPISVQVTSSVPRGYGVEVVALDSDGRAVVFPLADVGNNRFEGLFQSGRLGAPLRVRITPGDGADNRLNWESVREVDAAEPRPGHQRLRSFRQSTQFWLMIGTHPGFELAAQQQKAGAESDTAEAVHLLHGNVAWVPDTPAAFDGVNLIVATPGLLDAAQESAICQWVEQGGRLILALSTDTATWERSPFSQWCPIFNRGPYVERQESVLNGNLTALVPNSSRIISLDDLTLSRLEVPDGRVILQGPSSPVIAEAAIGFGTVVVVGLPLDQSPYYQPAGADGDTTGAQYWDGLPRLCQTLAGRAATHSSDGTAIGGSLSPTGVSDLQSQLAAILDSFPQVDRTSTGQVIALVGMWLVIIGPLEYLLVHHWLKRPYLTWLTLPLWVLVIGWWTNSAARADNGVTSEMQVLEVLDVAVDTGVVRYAGWASTYSPQTRRHDLSIQPDYGVAIDAAAPTGVEIGPMMRPEEGFRGMYRRGGLMAGDVGYSLESGVDAGAARGVPVEQWSSLSLAARGEASLAASQEPLGTVRAVYDTYNNLRRLDLEHHLPWPLEEWFVVHDVQARFPRTSTPQFLKLEPGATCDLLRDCNQNLVTSYLQGELTTERVRKHGKDVYVRSDTYDPLSLDANRWMRILTFHAAVGGSEFTHLSNQTLHRQDLSSLVKLNRLVVYGKIRRPLAEIRLDGEPRAAESRTTWVRLVIPVTRETAVYDERLEE